MCQNNVDDLVRKFEFKSVKHSIGERLPVRKLNDEIEPEIELQPLVGESLPIGKSIGVVDGRPCEGYNALGESNIEDPSVMNQ